jgi:hypothetical protein
MSLREHEQNAARCLALAEQLSDVTLKQSMIGMAAAWLRLAHQAEKNLSLDVVYEPPPARPAQRVMQQQQQIQPNKQKE